VDEPRKKKKKKNFARAIDDRADIKIKK